MLGLVSNSIERSGNDFSATEASVFLDGFNPEMLISTCLQENARRMSSFDDRLLLPEFLPTLAQFALSTLKLIPKRHPQNSQNLLKKEGAVLSRATQKN